MDKIADHHLKNGKLRIEKQELESLEIQLKAEKEIINFKESEISLNLKQITTIKNELGTLILT